MKRLILCLAAVLFPGLAAADAVPAFAEASTGKDAPSTAP